MKICLDCGDNMIKLENGNYYCICCGFGGNKYGKK